VAAGNFDGRISGAARDGLLAAQQV